MKIEVHVVSCKLCGRLFYGLSLQKAKKSHRGHLPDCAAFQFLKGLRGLRLKGRDIAVLLGDRKAKEEKR